MAPADPSDMAVRADPFFASAVPPLPIPDRSRGRRPCPVRVPVAVAVAWPVPVAWPPHTPCRGPIAATQRSRGNRPGRPCRRRRRRPEWMAWIPRPSPTYRTGQTIRTSGLSPEPRLVPCLALAVAPRWAPRWALGLATSLAPHLASHLAGLPAMSTPGVAWAGLDRRAGPARRPSPTNSSRATLVAV